MFLVIDYWLLVIGYGFLVIGYCWFQRSGLRDWFHRFGSIQFHFSVPGQIRDFPGTGLATSPASWLTGWLADWLAGWLALGV